MEPEMSTYDRTAELRAYQHLPEWYRNCPHCAEVIHIGYRACPACNRFITAYRYGEVFGSKTEKDKK